MLPIPLQRLAGLLEGGVGLLGTRPFQMRLLAAVTHGLLRCVPFLSRLLELGDEVVDHRPLVILVLLQQCLDLSFATLLVLCPVLFLVTVVPASPLPSGQYAEIQVIGIGPTAVVLTQPGKWTLGALFNQIWSTSGAKDRRDWGLVFQNGEVANSASATQRRLKGTAVEPLQLFLGTQGTYLLSLSEERLPSFEPLF